MKKKILVGAAVGTAGLVALTGATFAQSEGDAPGSGVRDRVAEILGIAPEELEDAVQQAREEHREEQLAERLATAVEEGVITQEEADAISSWLDDMPEALEGVGNGKRGAGVAMGAVQSDERITALVERLVDSEKIDEEDADEVADWLSGAPAEALAKLAESKDQDRPRHRGGFHGRMFGEGPGGRLFEGRFEIRPYTPPSELDEVEPAIETSVAVGEIA